MLQIERLTESFQVGEGPHWDPASQSLYFVDVLGMAVLRYCPQTRKLCRASVGLNLVSFIIPVQGEKHQFIVALGREIVRIFWNWEDEVISVIEKLVEVEKGEVDHRFNDGKCDGLGRLWTGTFNTVEESFLVYPPKGSLYSLSSKRNINKHLENVRLSNGLTFDSTHFYYIDSCKGTIDKYDFDLNSGKISNGSPIFTLKNHDINGIADGMTIDSDGHLWVAIFNGGQIIEIDTKKSETLLRTIDMPIKQITSLTFGGPNLDELYVTSASVKLAPNAVVPAESGALYRITGLGAKGLTPNNYHLVNI